MQLKVLLLALDIAVPHDAAPLAKNGSHFLAERTYAEVRANVVVCAHFVCDIPFQISYIGVGAQV